MAPFELNVEDFSSLTRLLRVTATAVRFINKLKGVKFESVFLTKEVESAETMWLKYIEKKHFAMVFEALTEEKKEKNLQRQLGVVFDDKGLPRCKGRLENAVLDEAAR